MFSRNLPFFTFSKILSNRSKEFLSLAKRSRFTGNNKSVGKRRVKLLAATVPLCFFGAGYYYYKNHKNRDDDFIPKILDHTFLDVKPNVPVTRTIKGIRDNFNLKLTLFQYPTCPFCCKVRAFLDYYGLPYEVIEVDPVLRQQTSWTTYKKVPILLAKVDGGYQQLNDSSMIISALKTYLYHQDLNLEEILTYYPIVEFKDNKGDVQADIFNKYFLMYQENVPKDKPSKVVKEEKQWREWADNELVHTLSPNVYRTRDEALQAFNWFSEVGEWKKIFPAWENFLIVHVGAFVMWMVGDRLKKRHRLKDDVRESLYDSCRKWMKLLDEKKTIFLGGSTPNLADLAVYGVLSSIEGCLAFNDLLSNTKIGKWYYPMKEAVNNHVGKTEFLTGSYRKAT
ncbi:hypothetical protein RUM43_003228 [Polyplax serrata]|uniref:Prostaglandin E synthase 2 n=1 Tax=Polyplax serrata TaxID=468196 RepID=A0AAN8PH48_POLSC